MTLKNPHGASSAKNDKIEFESGKNVFAGQGLGEVGNMRFGAIGAIHPGLLCFGIEEPGEAHTVGHPDRAHFGLQGIEAVAGGESVR